MSAQRINSIQSLYPDQSHTAVLSVDASKQAEIHSVSLLNASPALNAMAICQTANNSDFKMFTLQVADTDVSSSIQAGSAVTMFSTTNGQGSLFQGKNKFNCISFNVSQAGTGSPVFTYEYWNGSAYSTLTLVNTPNYVATGIKAIYFNPPVDWAVGDGTEGGDESFYSVRCLASTAPSQAIQINSLKVSKALAFSQDIDSGGRLELDYEGSPLLLQGGETIIPFFSYSDPANTIKIDYKIQS